MIFGKAHANRSIADLLGDDLYWVEEGDIYKGVSFPDGDDFHVSDRPVVFGRSANLEIQFCLDTYEIPVFSLMQSKSMKIHGYIFIPEFNYGYRYGEKHFNKHFSISADTLYQKSENYVSNLYYHFHEVEIEDHWRGHGWNSIVSQKFAMLDNDLFRIHGFYSALIDRVKDLAIQHPTLFLDFFIKRTIESAELIPVELSPTRKEIDDYFEHTKGKYFDETAYDLFATMTTDYFEGRAVRVPEVLITMTNGTKTAFAQQMGIVYKKLSKPKCPMKNNEVFFKILRSIDQFEGETSDQIYAALKR